LKTNKDISASKVRLIDKNGSQVGIVDIFQALKQAQQEGLDLVEIAPNAHPPVCKIINYSKFRYQMIKREKENKKAQHQAKLKEIKVKPNIDDHDLCVKVKRVHEFIEKGNKVRVTCMFRGREIIHPDRGEKVINQIIKKLEDVAQIETPLKFMGRNLSLVLAPISKKK